MMFLFHESITCTDRKTDNSKFTWHNVVSQTGLTRDDNG